MIRKPSFSAASASLLGTGLKTSRSNIKRVANVAKSKVARQKIIDTDGTLEQQAQCARLAEGLTDDELRLLFDAFKGWDAADIQLFFREERKDTVFFRTGEYVAYITKDPEGLDELQLWEEGTNRCLVSGCTSFVLDYAYRYCKAAVTVVLANAREHYVPPKNSAADFLDDPELTLADWRAFRRRCPALDRWSKKAQFESVDEDHPYYRFLWQDDELTGEKVSVRGLKPLCAETVSIPAAELAVHELRDSMEGYHTLVASIMGEGKEQTQELLEQLLSYPFSRVSAPLSVKLDAPVEACDKLRPHNLEVTWRGGGEQPAAPLRMAELARVYEANVSRNKAYAQHRFTARLKPVRTKGWELENVITWDPEISTASCVALSFVPRDRVERIMASWLPKKPRAAFRRLCMKQRVPDHIKDGGAANIPLLAIRRGPLLHQDVRLGTSAETFRSLVCSAGLHGLELRWGPVHGWSIYDPGGTSA